MLLAVDIGNTNISCGIFKGRRLIKKFSIPTRRYTLPKISQKTGRLAIDAAIICGVVPRLVWRVREALDGLHVSAELPDEARDEARRYFQAIKIVASGGFDPERIRQFERLGVPVDVYGVGSAFLGRANNDFTADVVRIKVGGAWYDMAKVGRAPGENPDLETVD